MLLPPELISNILLETSKPSVYECLFVCKSWYTIASRIYYHQVELILNHLPFLKMTQLQRIDGTFLGDHVRSLVFLYKDERGRITRTGDFTENPHQHLTHSLDANQFHQLMSCLPYLERIQFNAPCTVPSCHYLTYLKDNTPRLLQDIVLPVLASTTCSAQKNDYVACITRSFNTITRLYLDNIQFPHVLSLLAKMTRLQDLTIDNRNGSIKDENMSVVSVLNACHDLKSLDITDFSKPPPPTVRVIKRHHPHLSRLSLTGSVMTDDLVDALVNGTPSHLSYCHLDMMKHYISETSEIRLANHLRHTKTTLKVTHCSNRFVQYLAKSSQVVHVELVLFDDDAEPAQSIRVQNGTMHVKLVVNDLVNVDVSHAAASVRVTSHVSSVRVNDVMKKLLKSMKIVPKLIRVQCHSGSLYVDTKSLVMDRDILDKGCLEGIGNMFPALEQLTLEHWSILGEQQRHLVVLSSFKYIGRIRVHLETASGVCFKLTTTQMQKSVSYYYHSRQVVPCSGNMVAPVFLEIDLCPFDELELVFENKVVHTFYSKDM